MPAVASKRLDVEAEPVGGERRPSMPCVVRPGHERCERGIHRAVRPHEAEQRVTRSASSIALCAATTSCDPISPRSQRLVERAPSPPTANASQQVLGHVVQARGPVEVHDHRPDLHADEPTDGPAIASARRARDAWQTLAVQPAERLALGLRRRPSAPAGERRRGAEVLEDRRPRARAGEPRRPRAQLRRRRGRSRATPRPRSSPPRPSSCARGLQFGIDLQVRASPRGSMRRSAAMGLTRIIERPGMVTDPRALPDAIVRPTGS